MASERVEAAIADGYSKVYDAAENGDGDGAALAYENAVREVLAVEAAEHVSDPQATVTGLQAALENIGNILSAMDANIRNIYGVVVVPVKKREKAKAAAKVTARGRKAARKK